MNSLISSDQHIVLGGMLLGAAVFGLWAERYQWGVKLSGAIVTMLGSAILSNVGVLPVSSPLYDAVWSYLVPMAIPLLLFKANLFRIFRESGATLIAFLVGTLGTILGVFVAFWLIPLGSEAWKLAGIFCATYIGGSINYMATAQSLGLRSGDLLTAGVAADNLMMTVYFLILFSIPSITWVAKLYYGLSEERSTHGSYPPQRTALRLERYRVINWGLALMIAGLCYAAGLGVVAILDLHSGAILVITTLTVTLATFVPSLPQRFEEADRVGMLFMQIFFAAIGASANISKVMEVGPSLFVFAGIILTIHLITILLMGKIFRVGLPEILIASNANMGGPTTAAAMAAARGWDALVVPAVLCGTPGYVIATFIGVLVGNRMKV